MSMKFSKRMAILGCLAVVLAWTGVWAEFAVNHANTGLTGWRQLRNNNTQTGDWAVQDDFVRPLGWDGPKFLINNAPTSKDGILTVTLNKRDNWLNAEGEGVVFRYMNSSQFYYIGLSVGGEAGGNGWGGQKLIFGVNRIPARAATGTALDGEYSLNATQNSRLGSGPTYTFKVRVIGSQFTVLLGNNDSLTTFTHTAIDSGGVGYGAIQGGNNYGRFATSSWEPLNVTRELPANWVAWNTSPGNNITAGSGAWGDTRWSRGLLSSPLITWPTTGTRHALFGGRDSTIGVYRITAAAAAVDSMMFEANGYVIEAGTGALTMNNGRIVVPRGKTAQINATLAGTSGLHISSTGTGTDNAVLIFGTGAANTVSGASTIGANTTVRAARTGALGTGQVTVTAAGSRLELTGGAALTNRVFIGAEHLYSMSGTNNRIDSAVTLQGGAVAHIVTANAPLTMGPIGPATTAGLTKTGAASLTLAGANTYTGDTRVNTDTLFIGNGATGSLAGPLNIAQGAAAVFNRSNAVTQSGNISGAGSLLKGGAGTLTLTGTNSQHTGATIISAGAIEIPTTAALGMGTVTAESAGRLILNPAGTSSMDFGRTITSPSPLAGTLEKAGTGTVTLTGTAMTIGTVVVSGGTLGVRYTSLTTGLSADSILVSSGARLVGGVAPIGRSGARIRVNGGTLVNGAYYMGAVSLTGAGAAITRSVDTTVQISGSLNMAATSRLNVLLTPSMKGTIPAVSVTGTGTATIGGTLNITNNLFDSDTGTYRILQATSITGGFSGITVNDVDTSSSGYEFALTTVGGAVFLRISLPANASAVRNHLLVTDATFISEDVTGSTVRLTLSGFDGMRPHLTGNPSVSGIYIYYKPDGRATLWNDTISPSGRVQIHPSNQFTLPAGNTATVDVLIPAARGPIDAIYYFNVGVTWLFNGVAYDPSPPLSAAASVFPHSPARYVTANPLTIAVSNHSSAADKVTFTLTVSGQTAPTLTPNVDHKPNVDSVGVWIRRGGSSPPAFASASANALTQATVSGADDFLGFTLVQLRSNGTFTYEAAPVMTATETFYFAIAPRWTGAGIDSISRPLFVTNPPITVSAYDRPTPNNPTYLTATQPDVRARSVNIEVGVTAPFNELAATVRVEFSYNPQITGVFRDTVLTSAAVAATARFTIANDSLVGETRPVYYRITVLDATDFGVDAQGSFEVGRQPPLPPTGLVAEPNGGGTMRVRWNRVTPEANNIGEGPSAIWVAYSTSRPAATIDVSTMPGAVRLPITATETILSGMEYETDYWFAVMVHDIVSTTVPAFWNLKSAAATITANSGKDDIVPNIVEITSVVFNETTTNFTVNYKLLQAAGLGTTLRYYVLLGEDTVSRSTEPHNLRGFTVGHEDALQTLSLGAALQFNSTYHVYLYSVNPEDLPAAGRSVMEVEVGSFSSQLIIITRNGTASADNGRLGFIADKWSTAVEGVSCTLTITQSTLGENARGIEFLGEFGYEYTASAGAFLSVLDPLTIRIQADDNIMYSPRRSDVRLYRFKNNVWEVVYDTRYEDGYFTGTALDMVQEDMGSTYRLGIGIERPVVRIAGSVITNNAHPRPTVTVGEIILPSAETYSVESNIGNTRAFMLVAPANNPALSAFTRIEPNAVPSQNTSWAFVFNVDPQLVADAADFGLFMFLVVTDGFNTDTINVSRRVRSPSVYTGFQTTPEARKWLPFATQSHLEETSVKNVLSQLFAPDDDFVPYDTLFRLVRWAPDHSDAGLPGRWVEYGNVADDVFTLTPGRLMWIKTSSARTFNFGGATSSSLIDDFTITLPPGEWTDIVLPFTYDICLGDALEATSADNLHFYRWKQSGTSYITEQASVVIVDSSYIMKGRDDPFTVFNNGTAPVTLRVPPRPAFMSRHRGTAGQSKMMAAMGGSDLWYYSIRPKTQNAPELNEVMVGYAATERTFPVPPSFNNEAVVLVGEDGKLMGHHLSPAVSNGGKTFRLRFYNDEKQRTTFRFTSELKYGIPGDVQVSFINAVTGAVLLADSNGEYSLAVAGASYEDVYMVVGSKEYQAKITTPATTKFTVARISVNQAARSMRLRYYIPFAGIDRVEVSVYDIKGRMAWKNAERVRPGAWNMMEWNTRESRRSVGAGLYIVRVRAVDAKGRTVAVENRRITFAR